MQKFTSKHTACVHSGTKKGSAGGINTPVDTSTAYNYLNREQQFYPRSMNIPNQQAVIEKLAILENTETGLLFSSGMAAISSSLFSFLNPGDHLLVQRGIYGGTINLLQHDLQRMQISWSYPENNSPDGFATAIRPETKVVYVETPSNPLLEVIDLKSISTLCREKSILSVIDNTFASPINQNPINEGIDIVLHSATKYLGGHSDITAGVVLGSRPLIEIIRQSAVNFGGSLNALMCHLLERSLKTLALRVEKQNANAMALTRFLSDHDKVKQVFYPGLASHPNHDIARRQMPGFGGMLSFETLDGNGQGLQKRLQMIQSALSLGGIETTVVSPALTSHSLISAEERAREGITDGLLRLSVGIEDAADLMKDLDCALIG